MSQIRRSFVFSFAERYYSLVIGFIATIILARLLTPAETGLYSVAAGVIGIAQALREFGISNFIIQEKELSHAQLATTVGLALTLGITLLSLFNLGAGAIADFYSAPRLETIMQVLSLNFLLVPYAGIGLALLVRDMNFKAIMLISIASVSISTIASVALAAMGYGALGMAWSSVIGVAVSVAGNAITHPKRLFIRPSFQAWRQILHFGAFASGASILNMLAGKVPDIVIGRILGFMSVGLFSRGNGVITLFDTALMGSVSSVTNGAFATCHREHGDVRPLFLQSLTMITGVAWPFLTLLGLLAHPAILILFGHQWEASVPVAQILCVAAGFGILGSVCFMLFKAVGAVRKVFYIQVITVAIHIVGVATGSFFGLGWAACGFVASSLMSTLLAVAAVNRSFGTSWAQIGGAIFKSLLLAVVCAVVPAIVTWQWGFADGRFWGTALVGGFSGALFWIAGIFAVRHPLRAELTLLLRRLPGLRRKSRLPAREAQLP